MKHILTNSWHEILRFDEGEDVVAGILDFAGRNKIESAWLSAIGSSKELELSFYDLAKKEYSSRVFAEPLEIVSASGLIAVQADGDNSGRPVLHWHGVFSRDDFSTVGGHIKKLIANATVEVFIHKLNEKLARKHDDKTGLNLLNNE